MATQPTQHINPLLNEDEVRARLAQVNNPEVTQDFIPSARFWLMTPWNG